MQYAERPAFQYLYGMRTLNLKVHPVVHFIKKMAGRKENPIFHRNSGQ